MTLSWRPLQKQIQLQQPGADPEILGEGDGGSLGAEPLVGGLGA